MNIYKFSDVVKIISGGTPNTKIKEYWNGNIKWLSIADFKDVNKYVYDTDKKITLNGLEHSATKMLNKNDIIISARGTIGALAILSCPMAFNQSCFGLTSKDNSILLNEYIYYYLKNYIKILKYKKEGSVFGTIDTSTFDKILIKYPPIKEQQSIIKILSLLDHLIDIKNIINSELEQMAKALYNYWFVQFDFPDENGRPYKSSGGKMVWNEELQKEIPEGWEVENLANNSISSIIPVGIEYFNKKNYLETKNINNELISDGAWISYDNRENRANMQPQLNSIWFAKMKKSIKHITLPNNSKWFIDKYILSTGFFGIKCIYDAFSYVHCFINSDYFEAKKDILAHGATQKAVNNQDLERIPLIIPPTNLLKAFNSKIYNLLEMKLNMIKTNQELTSLRDFLLPLLMNGQAVIKE